MTRRDFMRDMIGGLGSEALLPQAPGAAGALAAFAAPGVAPTYEASPLGPGPVRITLTINGHPHEVIVDPRVTLLDALRERIGLTGLSRPSDVPA